MVAAKTTRLRRVGIMFSSSCACHDRRFVPIPDSWNAAKLFARDHLRKNRCTTPKAGLESVAEVVDIYQQATRRQR